MLGIRVLLGGQQMSFLPLPEQAGMLLICGMHLQHQPLPSDKACCSTVASEICALHATSITEGM